MNFHNLDSSVLRHINTAMIITMTVMAMMQVSVDHVAHMVSMRNQMVSTAISMFVLGLMVSAAMLGGALRSGIRKAMLIHMLTMNMVQMSIMQVIHMIVMLDS